MSSREEALAHLQARADGQDPPFRVVDAWHVAAELSRLRDLAAGPVPEDVAEALAWFREAPEERIRQAADGDGPAAEHAAVIVRHALAAVPDADALAAVRAVHDELRQWASACRSHSGGQRGHPFMQGVRTGNLNAADRYDEAAGKLAAALAAVPADRSAVRGIVAAHHPAYGPGVFAAQVITGCSCGWTPDSSGVGGQWDWHVTDALVADALAAVPAVPADEPREDAVAELRRMADGFDKIAAGSHGWVIRQDAAALRARADELAAARSVSPDDAPAATETVEPDAGPELYTVSAREIWTAVLTSDGNRPDGVVPNTAQCNRAVGLLRRRHLERDAAARKRLLAAIESAPDPATTETHTEYRIAGGDATFAPDPPITSPAHIQAVAAGAPIESRTVRVTRTETPWGQA